MDYLKRFFLLSILGLVSLFATLLYFFQDSKSTSYAKVKLLKNSSATGGSTFKKKEFIDIYSKPEVVSFGWKKGFAEQFYKDMAVIKQVVLDGEQNKDSRMRLLDNFREQQDWFDNAMSSTQMVGDVNYKELEKKSYIIGRIANAQIRPDALFSKSSEDLKMTNLTKKKIKSNILADINTPVSEELRRDLKYSTNSVLSDKVISNIVNKKEPVISKKDNITSEFLNFVNSRIGKLITKDDYKKFSKKLRKNISNELKGVFASAEKRLEKQSKKNNEEINRVYQSILNTLDAKLSSTEARLQMYIDNKMNEFTRKLDSFIEKETNNKGVIDLDIVENKMKHYFDRKFETVQNKLNISKIEQEKNQMKSIFNISKKNIDKKIYNEVGRQLSALKEDRIKRFEKLSRKKKKAARRKLLRNLLEKELDKNFS